MPVKGHTSVGERLGPPATPAEIFLPPHEAKQAGSPHAGSMPTGQRCGTSPGGEEVNPEPLAVINSCKTSCFFDVRSFFSATCWANKSRERLRATLGVKNRLPTLDVGPFVFLVSLGGQFICGRAVPKTNGKNAQTVFRPAAGKTWREASPSPRSLSKTARWSRCGRKPRHPWPGDLTKQTL